MSSTDRIDCIPQDQLADVVSSIEAEGENVITKFKTQCGWTVVYTTKNILSGGQTNNVIVSGGGGGSNAGSNSSGSIAISSGHLRVEISADDLDALCRIAQGEAGGFAKYGSAELEGGLAAVVDTVINRTAHKGYPDNIQEVIEQPLQFSPVNGLESWRKLKKAKPNVRNIIAEHLMSRVTGGPCSVRGATHFLNPHKSSPSALVKWGNHVVANYVAKFGSDTDKFVHYHGFAPEATLPRSYTLGLQGKSVNFKGNGTSEGAAVASGSFASKIVKICLEEFDLFGQGAKKESDDPQYIRVGDYWQILDMAHNGRTKLKNEATGEFYNPAWSSAFISFVLANAGALTRFKYSQAHCHYVQDFISGRVGGIYEAKHPDDYAPQVGDIVHFGRSYAKQYDFSVARSAYASDSFYPSHSDIIVEVDKTNSVVRTIGGNVGNSVDDKNFKIDGSGKLKPRKEGGHSYPWITVLRLLN